MAVSTSNGVNGVNGVSGINGVNGANGVKGSNQPAGAWAALSRWLPSRSPDTDYWWALTGPHLATMAEAAGYAIEQQYEQLLFLYHWIVRCPLANCVRPFS